MYSAMPSMNQSGSDAAAGTAPRPSGPDRPVMSYWKAWVSSCPMTWLRSPRVPPIGSTMRRRSASVTPPQLVPHHRAEARIPALGHPAGDIRRLALVGVEVHVEMVRLQHLEFEVLVLDLVAAEVLGFGRSREDQQGQTDERCKHSRHHTPGIHPL